MPPILLAVDKIYPKGLMWFRRDLRVDDNAALYQALRTCRQVVCVFVFDKAMLDGAARRRPAGRIHPRIAGGARCRAACVWAVG
jgi:hypothetical protein